jgi:hypothetical protein
MKMELWFLCTAIHLPALDHCMKFHRIPTNNFQDMHWTIKSNKGQQLLNVSRKIYYFCALRFLWIYLTIEWNCIEFQLVVFKLCSGQEKSNGKVTKGNNSIITVDRVMVLVHCTSSYYAWPLYEVVVLVCCIFF